MENTAKELFQDNLASHSFSFKKNKTKNKQSRTAAKATNHDGSFILSNS